MTFPKNVGMQLEHNPHKLVYMSVEDYLQDEGLSDVDEEVFEDMIHADEIWILQWYPDTPVGFYTAIGVTLEGVLEIAAGAPPEEVG